MLAKIQVEKNINWLMKNASYPVRCLTYKNLQNNDSGISSDLISEIEDSDLVKDIFSKQEKDGSWCSAGKWAAKPIMRKSGFTPVSPKYVTTAWILPILGDLGYTVRDERIKKACEYILSYQREDGYIGEMRPGALKRDIDTSENEPCRFSIALIALTKVRAVEDLKVIKSLDLLSGWQREDGGWISDNHSRQNSWTRSCPFASYHSTFALYSSKLGKYEKQVKRALEFLIDHLSAKNNTEIQRFFYHGHSIIHELLMFTEFKIGLDSRIMNSLLIWLLSMYQSDYSYFRYNGKPVAQYKLKSDYMDSKVAKYRLFHLIEDDWLTYYATRIFKKILDDKK